MAGKLEKAAGMAAQGGALFGAPGALIGGGLGLIFGHGDKTPQLPDFQFSPGSLASNNFSDLNLQTMNPSLYQQLMQNQGVLDGMKQALANRREGPTANEQRQMSQYMNQQGSGMASNGMAGTPMGNAMMADAQARMQAQNQDRAFQEYQAMQGQVANAQQQQFGNYQGAQNNLMNQMNANRQASMSRDQLMNERQLAQYGQDQQALAASNQMYGGMLGGGLQMLGSGADPILGNLGDHLSSAYDWLGNQFNGPSPASYSPAPMTGGMGLGNYSFAPSAPSNPYSMGYGQRPTPQMGFGYSQQLGQMGR